MVVVRYFSYSLLVIVFSAFLFSRTAEAKIGQEEEFVHLLESRHRDLLEKEKKARNLPALIQELVNAHQEIESLIALLIRAGKENKDPLSKKENESKKEDDFLALRPALDRENTGQSGFSFTTDKVDMENVLSALQQQKDFAMALVKAVKTIISEKDSVISAQKGRIRDLESHVNELTQTSATSSLAEPRVLSINSSSHFEIPQGIPQGPRASLTLSDSVHITVSSRPSSRPRMKSKLKEELLAHFLLRPQSLDPFQETNDSALIFENNDFSGLDGFTVSPQSPAMRIRRISSQIDPQEGFFDLLSRLSNENDRLTRELEITTENYKQINQEYEKALATINRYKQKQPSKQKENGLATECTHCAEAALDLRNTKKRNTYLNKALETVRERIKAIHKEKKEQAETLQKYVPALRELEQAYQQQDKLKDDSAKLEKDLSIHRQQHQAYLTQNVLYVQDNLQKDRKINEKDDKINELEKTVQSLNQLHVDKNKADEDLILNFLAKYFTQLESHKPSLTLQQNNSTPAKIRQRSYSLPHIDMENIPTHAPFPINGSKRFQEEEVY